MAAKKLVGRQSGKLDNETKERLRLANIIKHLVKIFTPESIEIELYFGSGSLSNKIGKSMPEANTLLNILEDYVNGAIIQNHRIVNRRLLMTELQLKWGLSPFESALPDSLFAQLHMNFLDLHYYAICIDKIDKLQRKLIERLSPLAHGAINNDEIRLKRSSAENCLKQALTPVADARNYLEHIEEHIAKGDFEGMTIETSENASKFTYGAGNEKHTINLSSLEQIKKTYEAVVEYISVLPDAE